MSRRSSLLAASIAAAGVAAASVAARSAADRKRMEQIVKLDPDLPFGSVHSIGLHVTATDGVDLYVEVDEAETGPTIIFAHGWVLNLDSWHYQRLALRGRARMVFYDHRSHGRSHRTAASGAKLEQLARDLKTIIDQTAPKGPIILVGHSMGGMTIMKLGELHPELFSKRVQGVVLVSTAAADIMRRGSAISRFVPMLRGLSFLVDTGRSLANLRLTRQFAIGPDADEKYAVMTYDMIGKTKTHAFIDFYPIFLSLDARTGLKSLSKTQTVVVAGTEDQLTPYRMSQSIAELVEGSELVTIEKAGHMTPLESNEIVTGVIEKLL